MMGIILVLFRCDNVIASEQNWERWIIPDFIHSRTD